MINGHGNNIYQYDGVSIEADFSSNIAFNNHSAQILRHLTTQMDSVKNYPDPMATRLTSLIARYHDTEESNVLVTNGSAEAFYLLAHYLTLSANRECRTAIATPAFAEYEDSCTLHKHQMSYFELCEFCALDTSNFDSVWLASPNNPNGLRISIADICSVANRNSSCKIVLDRAYNELSSEIEMCDSLPYNVILVQSFTKLYGIPGMRLGYIVAAPEIIASLGEMRPPWSINALGLVAGEYILTHLDELQIDIDELIGESQYLQNAIELINGFRVEKSNCNFFLVEITSGRCACELLQYLLEEHGLLIRDCSNFRGLGNNYFRIAAQERNYNDKLIQALQQWR